MTKGTPLFRAKNPGQDAVKVQVDFDPRSEGEVLHASAGGRSWQVAVMLNPGHAATVSGVPGLKFKTTESFPTATRVGPWLLSSDWDD